MSSTIKRHFILWTKNGCPYCDEATAILLESDHTFTVFEMSSNLDQLEKVQNQHHWSTVPLIVEQCSNGDRSFIGGCSDLERYLEIIK
jgi:glutaredoxin